MQQRAVSVRAGIGHDDFAAAVEDEMILVEMPMPAAVRAVLQAEPGCVAIGAVCRMANPLPVRFRDAVLVVVSRLLVSGRGRPGSVAD